MGSKVYAAFFYGDIAGILPIVGHTLEECLENIMYEIGFGADEHGYYDSRNTFIGIKTPDPKDDKIEVWEIDINEKSIKIVWGFWGWHWEKPEDAEQGIMPGHTKSLYDLAMEE